MKLALHWKILSTVGLTLFIGWTLFPFYWMFVTAFKSDRELYSRIPTLWPQQFVLEHFIELFDRIGFVLFLRNSIIIASVTTAASIVFGLLAAYALTRLNFRGRRIAGLSIILTYLVPPGVLFIPLFVVLRSLSVANTLHGLVLADLTLTIPFCTWLLIGYLQSLPRELEEAALVDGCNRPQVLLRIVLPLVTPAIAVVALFSFTVAWNEFLYAVVFTSSEQAMPLTAALASMRADDIFFWGQMMAMSLLTAIPPALLYFFAQKWITSGLVVGGVKG